MKWPVIAGVCAMVATGCGAFDAAPTVPEQRAAAKETCPEAVLESTLPALDRVLVPYSPQLLGVETTFGYPDRRVRIVSGGYLDDVFEAYDDMVEVDVSQVRGVEAIVLQSELLGDPVFAAVWREREEPPCDAHALIATGFAEEDFRALLDAVR